MVKLRELIVRAYQRFYNIGSLRNELSKRPQQPHKCRCCVGLVDAGQSLDQAFPHFVKLLREFPQHVLEAHHRFIDQMRFSTFVELAQILEKGSSNLLQPQADDTETLDGASADNFVILVSVFVELVEHIPQVGLAGQCSEDIEFDEFDVGGLIDLEVEVLEIGLEYSFGVEHPDHVFDVLQNDIGCFRRAGHLTRAH